MILAKVEFGRRTKDHEFAELESFAQTYLAALLHNGQADGEPLLAWNRGRLTVYIMVAGPSAVARRHHSDWGKSSLDEVIKRFGRAPAWSMLDDRAGGRRTSWKAAPLLYLFTHALAIGPPVCRGDGKEPVPVFALPVSFEIKQQLRSWQEAYREFDRIWLGSGALEMPAYRQLADPSSELAATGRRLCREIEDATGVPTYYYLQRYWGRLKGEEDRACPGCGTKWRTTETRSKRWRFCEFDFRCDGCRLVSHIADTVEDGRHARIGEFRDRRNTPRAR